MGISSRCSHKDRETRLSGSVILLTLDFSFLFRPQFGGFLDKGLEECVFKVVERLLSLEHMLVEFFLEVRCLIHSLFCISYLALVVLNEANLLDGSADLLDGVERHLKFGDLHLVVFDLLLLLADAEDLLAEFAEHDAPLDVGSVLGNGGVRLDSADHVLHSLGVGCDEIHLVLSTENVLLGVHGDFLHLDVQLREVLEVELDIDGAGVLGTSEVGGESLGGGG